MVSLKSRKAFLNSKRSRRGSYATKLNLISLMDIFTMLVFFLLINSSTVSVLQDSSSLVLPESTSKSTYKEQLAIVITNDDILIQTNFIDSIQNVKKQNSDKIDLLLSELTYQYNKKKSEKGFTKEEETLGLPITILGDHKTPYWLLKKIIYTCQQSHFTRISLAVNHTASKVDA